MTKKEKKKLLNEMKKIKTTDEKRAFLILFCERFCPDVQPINATDEEIESGFLQIKGVFNSV